MARDALSSINPNSAPSRHDASTALARAFESAAKSYLGINVFLTSADYAAFAAYARRVGVRTGRERIESMVRKWPRLGAGRLSAENLLAVCAKPV